MPRLLLLLLLLTAIASETFGDGDQVRSDGSIVRGSRPACMQHVHGFAAST
jgi:hypothetical protein